MHTNNTNRHCADLYARAKIEATFAIYAGSGSGFHGFSVFRSFLLFYLVQVNRVWTEFDFHAVFGLWVSESLCSCVVTGKSIVKRLPWPSSLRTITLPLWAW